MRRRTCSSDMVKHVAGARRTRAFAISVAGAGAGATRPARRTRPQGGSYQHVHTAEPQTDAALGALPPETEIANPITWWAEARTAAATAERPAMIRSKSQAVLAFFRFCRQRPEAVTDGDVRAWIADLRAQGLAEGTVYGRVSKLSSFYMWAMQDARLRRLITRNPVALVRPRAPKPYQNRKAQALTAEEAAALLDVVRARADRGDIVGKRDYALLRLFLMTGMRRREIVNLQWQDVRCEPDGQTLVLLARVKGGDLLEREVQDPQTLAALLTYLRESGRLAAMQPASPLWAAHDHARATPPGGGRTAADGQPELRRPEDPLTGWGLAKNLKRYAAQAGLPAFHLHQTRHTFARIIAERSGSLPEVQQALNHQHIATTRHYVRRIARRRDRYSGWVGAELGER